MAPPWTRGRAAARSAAALRLPDLPPELIARIAGNLDCVHDLAAANATARLFRGPPIERALVARARARGHEHALPATLPTHVRTWTEELLARECVWKYACAHLRVVVSSSGAPPLSAFVDADGGVHTCGSALAHPDVLGSTPAPRRVITTPRRVASLSAVRVCAVAAGHTHLLALSDVGAVYACGSHNFRGQLGVGDRDGRAAFVWLTALRAELVVGIGAGGEQSFAHTAAGAAYSWGNNSSGELGHGDCLGRLEPTRIEALDGVRVAGVAVGGCHALLLSACGRVYSCGLDEAGRLGHGEGHPWRPQCTPRPIEALAGVRAVHVSTGGTHSLVVDAAGGVHSFGQGGDGCLGHGQQSRVPVPKRIEALASVHAVCATAGTSSSAVLGADGSVRVFGRDACRWPGHADLLEPTRVGALAQTHVVGCELGQDTALFLTAGGDVHACGKPVAALGLGLYAPAQQHGVGGGPVLEAVVSPTRVEQLPRLRTTALIDRWPRTATVGDGRRRAL